jgi:hypothetical protein
VTLKDYSVTAFTVFNGVRIVAYLPQIVCLHRDRAGAFSVSMITWGMFFLANAATAVYSLAVVEDHIMAAIFAANAIASVVIFALILNKRIAHGWNEKRTEGSLPAMSLFGQFSIIEWLSRLRQGWRIE